MPPSFIACLLIPGAPAPINRPALINPPAMLIAPLPPATHDAAPILPLPLSHLQGSVDEKALVAQVNKAKDLYDVLGLTKAAGETDVKKAYRKVSLHALY